MTSSSESGTKTPQFKNLSYKAGIEQWASLVETASMDMGAHFPVHSAEPPPDYPRPPEPPANASRAVSDAYHRSLETKEKHLKAIKKFMGYFAADIQADMEKFTETQKVSFGFFAEATLRLLLRRGAPLLQKQADLMQIFNSLDMGKEESFGNFKNRILKLLRHAKLLDISGHTLQYVPLTVVRAATKKLVLGELHVNLQNDLSRLHEGTMTPDAFRIVYAAELNLNMEVQRTFLVTGPDGAPIQYTESRTNQEEVVRVVLHAIERRITVTANQQNAASESGAAKQQPDPAVIGYTQGEGQPSKRARKGKKKKEAGNQQNGTQQPPAGQKATAQAQVQAAQTSMESAVLQKMEEKLEALLQRMQPPPFQPRGRGGGGYGGNRNRGGYPNSNTRGGRYPNKTWPPNNVGTNVVMGLPDSNNEATGSYSLHMVHIQLMNAPATGADQYLLDCGAGLNCYTKATTLLRTRPGEAVTIVTATGREVCPTWGLHAVFGWGIIAPHLEVNLVSFDVLERTGFKITVGSDEQGFLSFSIETPKADATLVTKRRGGLFYLVPKTPETKFVPTFMATPAKGG